MAASDPVTGVSNAVTEIAKDIVLLSPKTHPVVYFFKMHRLTNLIMRDCKKYPHLLVEDEVHACCSNLEPTEQAFLIQVVKEKLGLPIK